MKTKIPQLFSLILLLGLGFSCKEPKNHTALTTNDSFEQTLDSLRKQYRLPGLCVGVSKNDSVVFSKAFGFAVLEDSTPITTTTPFRIASLTKPIFSTIIMRLVEEGKIDLNAKVKDLYPGYQNKCERLLHYFNTQQPEYSFLLNEYNFQRDDILIKHHLSHTAENVPGTAYKYNGFLFGMLSDVVKTQTGISFDEWVDQLIIEELELLHSASSQLDSSKTQLLKEIAHPYKALENDRFQLQNFPNKELNAGAGLVFSLEDLLTFDRALNQNKIISKTSKQKAFTPFLLANGTNSPYAYGWFVQQHAGRTLVWHYGLQENSYSSLYLKVLEDNITLLMLSNGDGLSAPFQLNRGNVLNTAFVNSFLSHYLNEL